MATGPSKALGSLSKLGIAHVGIQVSDLKRSLAFYTDLLNLRSENNKPGLAFLSAGPDLLVLYQKGGGISDFHFGFRLDKRSEVDKWKSWLKSNKVRIYEDISETGHPRSFKIKDPDGYWVEISSKH